MDKYLIFVELILFMVNVNGKYVEGEIKTSENWAFLTRFCFLSEEGQFEYYIEYNDDQGEPNLLLYYDTEDQWPSVYKSNKTCFERELVLNREQNQIVNLTSKYREFSGCGIKSTVSPTIKTPSYTIIIPTFPSKNVTKSITTTTPLTTINRVFTTSSTIITTTTTSETTTIELDSTLNNINSASKITSSNINEEFVTSSQNLKFDFETILNTETTSIIPITDHTVPIRKRSVPVKIPLKKYKIGKTVACHNARRFRSSRERWWFIAVSNCNGTKGINIKYKILMTNGDSGDYWHEHFSADEFYILPVLMAFSIAYSFIMLGIVVCSVELKSRQLLHSTYKVFVASVIFQLFGILLQSIAYLKYATNGIEPKKLKRTGGVFMGASEIHFLLLLLLLAKGYTVTRGRLPLSASVKLTIFMCCYVVTYISLFVFEAKVFDPGEVLYLYESPAGYGLIVLRLIAWVMFIYSTAFTLKHYPEKCNFYYPFVLSGTLWCLAGPIFILSANTYIDKWVRESIVCAVLLFITFGGHLMFLILTMPSVANKNFPYHVRTTQIGIMEMSNNTLGGPDSIEQFTHHAYEPTTTTVAEQTLIIPLTRRTEEIFEGMYNQRMHTAFRNNSANNNTTNEEGFSNNRDVAMQNVMNWSLAKNIPALELPNFERIERSELSSGNSRMSDNSFQPSMLNNSPVNNHVNETPKGRFDDYVRDVPVELFTVSKMVVTTNNLQRSSSQH